MINSDWALGRVAIVTGATAGFGAAIAKRIHRAGGCIIATGRRSERLDALAAELGNERVFTAAFDVRDTAALSSVLTELPSDFAAIDILVNNAGLALGLEPAQQAEIGNWHTMIETNVTALVQVTHAILPGMVARNRGHIINIASVAASYPYPGGNVYGATKAFVRQFSLNLRADLLGTPLRVTSVEPGMCETEFSVVRMGSSVAAAKVYAGMTPLSADDVADTVEWALSRPPHVNVNTLEVMPVAQAFAPFSVSRET